MIYDVILSDVIIHEMNAKSYCLTVQTINNGWGVSPDSLFMAMHRQCSIKPFSAGLNETRQTSEIYMQQSTLEALKYNLYSTKYIGSPYSTADAWLKKKFQVAGRTTFCHLFFINPYVIGTQKLPVASPKNMYNLYYSHLKMTTPCRSKGWFRVNEII